MIDKLIIKNLGAVRRVCSFHSIVLKYTLRLIRNYMLHSESRVVTLLLLFRNEKLWHLLSITVLAWARLPRIVLDAAFIISFY